MSSKLAHAQEMSSRCAMRDEVTWLILPTSGWRQDLTKPGNLYEETNLRQACVARESFRHARERKNRPCSRKRLARPLPEKKSKAMGSEVNSE